MCIRDSFNGEDMTLSEAVARIVNAQINELVERCVKNNETRHYLSLIHISYKMLVTILMSWLIWYQCKMIMVNHIVAVVPLPSCSK